MENKYTKIERKLPLIPLRGLAIFPYMILNFDVEWDMENEGFGCHPCV